MFRGSTVLRGSGCAVAYSEISSQLIPRQRQMQFSCQIDVVKIQTSPLPIWPNVEFPDRLFRLPRVQLRASLSELGAGRTHCRVPILGASLSLRQGRDRTNMNGHKRILNLHQLAMSLIERRSGRSVANSSVCLCSGSPRPCSWAKELSQITQSPVINI
jgi:hypothetical protein